MLTNFMFTFVCTVFVNAKIAASFDYKSEVVLVDGIAQYVEEEREHLDKLKRYSKCLKHKQFLICYANWQIICLLL